MVLGGAHQHCKIVNTAKKMGVYTIVADYLKESPAKLICDKDYMIDIMDIDAIVDMCKKENVDGVMVGFLDPCQRPYNQVCERLGLPCFGTAEQFFNFTDKHAFKKMCVENGVDVIDEYTEDDVRNGNVEYPLFIKPVDSRGSRGQTVCYNYEDVEAAIIFAKQESSNGDILIEKYMENVDEFQVTYFVIDGKAYLIRTVDSHCGSVEDKLEKVVSCAVSPSKNTQRYIDSAHKNVLEMIKKAGIKNGPVFMQGFYDGNKFRFFDPGLRFPGVEYELIYNRVFELDIIEILIEYALTGDISKHWLPENGVMLNDKRAAVLFPTLRSGKISEICGVDDIQKMDSVVAFTQRYDVGDSVAWSYNVNQRFAEIDVLSNSLCDLKTKIQEIQSKLIVTGEKGENMSYGIFDVERIEA